MEVYESSALVLLSYSLAYITVANIINIYNTSRSVT